MRVGYLSYSQGFELNVLLRVIKENRIEVDDIFLPRVMINPFDMAKFSEEVLQGIPFELNESIDEGFSEETIIWLKNNIRFQHLKDKTLLLERKVNANGITFFVFIVREDEKEAKFIPGRASSEHIDGQMVMVEVSIDDMNPEFYSYILEGLFSLGVNDVYINQVLMKKNRPGQVIHVLCQEEIKEKVVNFLFKETTTLGIRYTPYFVHRLEREFVKVDTKWGSVNVKVGIFQGDIVQIAPEFSDCHTLAKKNNVALKIVYDEAKGMGYKLLK